MTWQAAGIDVATAAAASWLIAMSNLYVRIRTWLDKDYVELMVSSSTPRLHRVELYSHGRRYVALIHGDVSEAYDRGQQMIREHR